MIRVEKVIVTDKTDKDMEIKDKEALNWEKLQDFYQGKRILVTGHTGFKGAWLSKILLMLGAKVIGYALEPPTEINLYHILGLEEKMESIKGDIRDLSYLQRIFERIKPELVIHMAAQPLVRASYQDPVYTYETNVMGTVNILECVRLSQSVKSFLNVTTDKVYENKEWERGYVEEDILDGYDPYSNSKSCSELVTHSYKKSFLKDIPISTARAGNVIGGGDFAEDRIIPDCVRAGIVGQKVILRNPKSIRPFQYVLEPLAIYLEIVMRQYQNREKYQGYFNVGPEDEDCITAQSLVECFQKFWGDGFDYQIQSDNGPHEAGFLKLNCDKLKRIYNWQSKFDVYKAVEYSVKWYQAYRDGEDMNQITECQILDFFNEDKRRLYHV